MKALKEKPFVFIIAATEEEVQALVSARGLPESVSWEDQIFESVAKKYDHNPSTSDQIEMLKELKNIVLGKKVPVIHCLANSPGTVREIAQRVGPNRLRTERHMLPEIIFFLPDELWIGGTDGWFDVRDRETSSIKRFTLEEIATLTTETK